MNARQEIDTYLEGQADLETLRFITCGSVDDGKSTLIGRMLYESQMILDDQLSELEKTSSKIGTQGEQIDFALLVDGLSAEREQGITIDVAYRYFSTDQRKFIVADTPGHEQYTRNMVTGASTADAAVVLVDARKGVLEQTRRHSFIVSLLGIRHVVLAVNKMDLVGFDQAIFDDIVAEYQDLCRRFNFETVTPIPISALGGDNVVVRSASTPWYRGPTLLGFLGAVDTRKALVDHGFRMPVQWVNRPNLDFRGYAGTVLAGRIAPGDDIRILPSGETATVKGIVLGEDELEAAQADQAVTLTLDRDVDISRGDVLVAAKDPCETSDQFEARIVWMARDSGFHGRTYLMKIGTASVNAAISEIRHTYNINTFEEMMGRSLELNDISVVKLALDRPVAFEPYGDCPPMGAFVLIDRQNHQTVAAGMIDFALRRADNVHRQAVTVDKKARAKLNGHPGRVLWFTGLSGSGKSTIANALEKKLHAKGFRTYILDGDNVRLGLNRDLGFTDADRVENIRRIAEVAKLMVDAGLIVMTAFISPFRAERQMAREMFEEGEFVEIFVDTPLEVAEERDPKGLYRKARRGELPNFTGIDSPYEAPEAPEFRLETEGGQAEKLAEGLLSGLKLEIDD
ncbi:sulfate adenylyltransferase subunit CysN [Hoeflea poritis]|uniref:Multifunctional fusion protein n=1 Tax=Hoeflea poritis TaxID=2993659 RepID=A0ABT4VQV3_9HYPH|nr:sulfate adenylyltransferase subunit CysN [Hoeflea poritis]MDA4846555.1 sulfate adenylyltransferase subunit CysN [Hoeflea poritis]